MNKTFDHISISIFQCLAEKLKEQGLNIEGNQGFLSKNGISLDYRFDTRLETLTIENLEVGFPASLAGMNTEKVMGILEKTIAGCSV